MRKLLIIALLLVFAGTAFPGTIAEQDSVFKVFDNISTKKLTNQHAAEQANALMASVLGFSNYGYATVDNITGDSTGSCAPTWVINFVEFTPMSVDTGGHTTVYPLSVLVYAGSDTTRLWIPGKYSLPLLDCEYTPVYYRKVRCDSFQLDGSLATVGDSGSVWSVFYAGY